MATFPKPKNVKYTDMCIYVDKNMPKVVEVGKYPDIESQIFEYLYHIIYALACKGMFFKNFADYDTFALNSATELYNTMRYKWAHKGEIIRGKEVVPIKSCLNFIKSVLFPLKVNYQKENFSGVLNPEINEEVVFIGEQMKESVRVTYRQDLLESYTDTIERIPDRIRGVLNKSPYRNDKLFMQKLYISCALTLLNDVTIPNKIRKKVDRGTHKKPEESTNRYSALYTWNAEEPILWHIDEKYSDYIKLLVRQVRHYTSIDLEKDVHEFDLSEDLVNKVIDSVYATYDYDEE